MLRNLKSPEIYFQAAFRVQSPWSIKNPNGDDPNEEEVFKPACFVFDFAPTRALRQLAAAVRTGHLAPRFHVADPRSRRLSLILQTIDGAMAMAPQREIAVALFGRRRVEVDWGDPADHVRDRVRRAIRRGRSLIDRGYLDLLR